MSLRIDIRNGFFVFPAETVRMGDENSVSAARFFFLQGVVAAVDSADRVLSEGQRSRD